MAVARDYQFIIDRMNDPECRYDRDSARQMQMDLMTILIEGNSSGAIDLTTVEQCLDDLKNHVLAQTTNDTTESDETQTILSSIQTAQTALASQNQTEDDETQTLLSDVLAAIQAQPAFDATGIIAEIDAEGDETQAKLDDLIAAVLDAANAVDVIPITSGTVGNNLRGVATVLILSLIHI